MLQTKLHMLLKNHMHFNYFQMKQLKNKRVSKRDKAKIKPSKYAGVVYNNSEIRVHISFFDKVMEWVKAVGLKEGEYKIIDMSCVKGKKIKVKLKKGWKPRDYQEEPIKWIVNNDGKDKLLTFQPGDGKTFMCVAALCKLQRRAVFIIKPRYMDKWVSDLTEITDVHEDKILKISGGRNLQDWLEAYDEMDQGHDFIIISNRTFFDYIKHYEEGVGSDIRPDNYAAVFDAGILVIDEIHQDFNFNFRLSLYTNACLLIGMSGTFLSSDKITERYMYTMFPKYDRLKHRVKEAYIDIFAIGYRFDQHNVPSKYHYSLADAYNHIKFERFIMSSKYRLYDYTKLINEEFKTYIKRREEGDKCLIYCASIAMCHFFCHFLSIQYKDLKITTKVEGDDYSVILENDVIVSTVQSSGTAFDIPGLITVLQTMSIDTSQSNLQSLGRLRDLKDKIVEFYYFYTPDIEKQFTYHRNRIQLFKSLAKSYREFKSPIKIGESYSKAKQHPHIYSTVEKIDALKDYVMLRDVENNVPRQIKELEKKLENFNGKAERRRWMKSKLTRLINLNDKYQQNAKRIRKRFEDLFTYIRD